MSTVTSEIRLRIRAEGDKVLADLGTKLNSLANQATLSSNNFKGLAEELKKVQQTTVQSARNIKDYSASWRELASSVDISSKEFRQATAEAALLDAQLAKVQGTSVRTAAAVQTAMRGPVTGGTAGAGIMGKAATPLEPYPRLGFETLDPEFWRERQRNAKDKQGNVLGQLNQPQFLDYGATDKALGNLQDSLQNIRDIENRSKIERLELQEKYNNLEIKKQDQHAAKVLAKDRENADIGGRDFMQRLENREKQKSQRRQRFAGAAQTAGAIAASGIFGGPEGLVGSGIGAVVGGPMGAAAGGAIGAQVGMLRQAIGETATYASEIAKLNIALKGITKTSEEYNDAQDAINSISKSLNVPIKEATSGFTKLSASVIGAGGSVNEAEIVMRGFTQAIKATGGGAQEVAGAMTALTQIFSKGKVSAEEINQIAERLPGAFTAIAKAAGKTGPELQKALENGEVGLNDLMKTAQYLTDQYGASANKMAASTEESGARMTIALDEVKLAIGSAFQPIGSEFQESITEMAKAAVAALKIFKEKIDESNKSIANLIGNDNLKGIQFFFKTIVLEAAAAVDPLTKIYLNLQRIKEFVPKGDPNLTQQQLADTGMAGRYAIPVKPLKKFEEPKGKDDDNNKKAIKDKLDAETQEKINKINKEASEKQLNNLKYITYYENKISDLQSLQTENNKKESIEKIRQLQSDVLLAQSLNDRIELQRVLETGLAQLVKEDNTRLRLAQRAKLINDYSLAAKKSELKLSEDQNKVLSGRKKDATQQAETTAKELTDSQRLFLVLQDQLKIARATTPEQKIREESKARMNELDRDAAALVLTRADGTVKEKDAQNLILQIELERLNLQTQLAALQPKSPLQEFVKQASTELQNLEGVAVTVSQGIGDAIGNSLSSGIQGLVEGTANAQQIFSDFLKSIGQILIQEGAKMIATYTAIAIAKSLAGLFGGGNTVPIDQGGSGMLAGNPLEGFDIPTRAAGGPVSSNSTYMVGEKGPELFVPRTSGTIVPADATAAAMARYQRQGGSSGGSSGSDAMGAGEAATPVLSMSFETTRFLGQDYVSTDQLQAAMMATEKRAATAGAKAGAAQVSSQMRNSPAYRRQVGLR